MAICKRVLYKGRVQGVGFRYTAKSLAQKYPVTGFVRNLSDGSVELLAEGDEEQVNALLDDVSETMSSYINTQTTEAASVQHFSVFEIRI